MLWEIFMTSLKLGLTSFGGPSAHLGYFQQMYVQQKKWLTDEEYADLVALSQFLPGPASSQVGMGIGYRKGGVLGSICAFLGFTMPSVIILMLFVYFLEVASTDFSWLQGLKLVAIAIVAHAILDMAKKLLVTKWHIVLMLFSTLALLFFMTSYTQVLVIIIAGLIGYIAFSATGSTTKANAIFSRKMGIICVTSFAILLVGLPIIARLVEFEWLTLFSQFYVAGSLVFGGGHVVLPLLEAQFVQTGVLTADEFLAGYGMTQAVPGPLFTFASYIGMVIGGVPIALLATVAIFLPAFLLILGVYPFWARLSTHPKLRGAISGMNAAVVGILLAAFFTPMITSTIHSLLDVCVALILFVLLYVGKVKPFVIVLLGVVIGLVFY